MIEKEMVQSLAQFYDLMDKTCKIRTRIVAQYLQNSPIDNSDIISLETALDML